MQISPVTTYLRDEQEHYQQRRLYERIEQQCAKKQYDDLVTLAIFKDIARLRNRLNQSGDSMVWHGPEFAYRALT